MTLEMLARLISSTTSTWGLGSLRACSAMRFQNTFNHFKAHPACVGLNGTQPLHELFVAV